MRYITERELQERIMQSLRERKLVIEKSAGYVTWNEIKIEKDNFAGGLEKVIREILQL